MPYSIVIHEDAEEDLDALWNDPATREAAARIDVLLEEVSADQDLLDALTIHDYGKYETAPMSVSKWQEYWRKGADIWRLKFWELTNAGLHYRIVYAYEIPKQRYHVLAIVHRNFNYDESHPITKRILANYKAIVD
jgi:mRNA-degrading endonuclease RelE of RelBE toxin-antitoxin system